MTLLDFAAKKQKEVRREGWIHAAKTGVKEATSKAYRPLSEYRATPIWAGEWDVCLVLDACRFDLWREVAPEYGLPVTSGWSVGSASVEWLNETFADRHRDGWETAGYVTANPHTAKTSGFGPFTDAGVYPISDRGLPYLDEVWVDQWNVDEFETVRPEAVTKRGLWAWEHRERHGFDHLVVHYMQPHIPFRDHGWSTGWKNTLAFGEHPQETDTKSDWEQLRDGEVDRETFWAAYADNLRWALDAVAEWVERTSARLLVTSDHGNAAGDWGLWGHPPGSHCPELRRVPWACIEGIGDGDIDVDPPGDPPERAALDADTGVEGRLKALGYM